MLTRIDWLAGLGCTKEMAGSIAIEGGEPALGFHDVPNAGHNCPGRLLIHQLCIVDLAGGIVQNHDQVELTFILKPTMLAAIDVQQHPRNRTPRAPPPVRTSLPSRCN